MGGPRKGAALAAPAYRRRHGDLLSDAEVAHLLTRAATGERLTHGPVWTPTGYRLAHLATLSAEQRADLARRVRAVTAALNTFAAPALLA